MVLTCGQKLKWCCSGGERQKRLMVGFMHHISNESERDNNKCWTLMCQNIFYAAWFNKQMNYEKIRREENLEK